MAGKDIYHREASGVITRNGVKSRRSAVAYLDIWIEFRRNRRPLAAISDIPTNTGRGTNASRVEVLGVEKIARVNYPYRNIP